MSWLRRLALAVLGRYGATLRFPHLLLLTGLLFAVDLLVPDAIPMVDEIGLGLLTLVFAAWRKREGRHAEDPGQARRGRGRPPPPKR